MTFVLAVLSSLAFAGGLWIQDPVAPAVPLSPSSAQEPGAKPERAKKAEPPVYDEKADATKDVAAAVERSKRENKRVLIQWGANWCGWCKWLAGTMKKDSAVRRTLMYEYEVVHVDVGQFDKHMDLAKSLGADFKAIPYLTILDADGKSLVQQNTEPFETNEGGKQGHDAKKIDAFLKQHAASPLVASDVLAAAQKLAQESDRRVFLHFGAPWCGWCHKLEDWMRKGDIAAVLGKDFVDCKVDTDRMTGGQEMLDGYRAGAGLKKGGGIPWFVFLDKDGKVLAHSDGPEGNTGFPAKPEEIEHFAAMLKAAKVRITDEDIATLRTSLQPKKD
jgi:thiol-disulfide isomerase/thioredoxin